MRFYKKNPLVLLSLICSILFFTSCSKDSDLFAESISQDSETETIENADGADRSESTEPSSNGDGVNLLLNGTFENSDEWELLNGSTATGGVLTVIANGSIGSDFPNWSAQYPNISPQSFYETRRYRLTFTARQVSGNDILQVGQRFATVFEEQITRDFQTYIFEFNGDENPAGNDLVFGGRGLADVFEIKDVILEDIGALVLGDNASSDEGRTSLPPQITFFTDFETDQWGESGEKEPAGNFWEVDHGAPRTTDHPDSPLKAGRNGTGRAIWLGAYNNDPTRNEVGKDDALSLREHWMGVSIYVQDKLNIARILIQNRLIANGSSKTVNAISLRQAEDPGKLYFSIPTDVNSVDTLPANGAGSNTESVFFDYNEGEWIDIVLHYKGAFGADYQGPNTSELARNLGFDPRSDGYIEIWVNGEKIVDHVGTTVYRYARPGQEITGVISPKIGPYWSSAFSPKGDVYYDNYSLWVGPDGSFEDVNPNR